MTSLDDDPEYEAQLRDVLGDSADTWTTTGDAAAIDSQDGGEPDTLLRDNNAESDNEDRVIANAPSFRMKKGRPQERQRTLNEDQLEVPLAGDERALSEDARSISTADDSPSAQVSIHSNSDYQR